MTTHINVRNAVFNGLGGVDCEVEHPLYGWVGFTASPDDSAEHSQAVLSAALSLGPTPYEPPPLPHGPTRAEQVSVIEAQRDDVLAAGVDHNGIRWHADITFLSELTTIILGYTIGVRSGTTAIRTKQSTIEHLELPALVALAGAVGNHRAAAFALSWAAKDALNAS